MMKGAKKTEAEDVYAWFTVGKFGENDYRVIKSQRPLPAKFESGTRFNLPHEVFDYWNSDAGDFLEQFVNEAEFGLLQCVDIESKGA